VLFGEGVAEEAGQMSCCECAFAIWSGEEEAGGGEDMQARCCECNLAFSIMVGWYDLVCEFVKEENCQQM
jgi:hypothetical protein